MTEHKYTDEEVIKGIKCCIIGDCGGCPINTGSACRDYLFDGAIDLINRQKAEIAFWMDAAANAKKEAVKEFTEGKT